jgi:hypothetical protein
VINRISLGVVIKVGISSGEQGRIFSSPPADRRIVVASTEANEFRILIVQVASKAEGLESWICIGQRVGERPVCPWVCPYRSFSSVIFRWEMGNPPFAKKASMGALGHDSLDRMKFHAGA